MSAEISSSSTPVSVSTPAQESKRRDRINQFLYLVSTKCVFVARDIVLCIVAMAQSVCMIGLDLGLVLACAGFAGEDQTESVRKRFWEGGDVSVRRKVAEANGLSTFIYWQ